MSDALAWTETRLLLVDLDGTLHADERILGYLDRAFLDFVAMTRGISTSVVEEELEAFRAGRWRTVASTPSEFSFLVHSHCNIDGWLDSATTALHLVDDIPVSTDLENALRSIGSVMPLALTTNSPWALASAIIRHLGIEDVFDLICCPRQPHALVSFPRFGKPSTALYHAVAEHFDVAREDTLVIGDRTPVDIDPAIELGMHARQVRGPNEVVGVLRTILSVRASD